MMSCYLSKLFDPVCRIIVRRGVAFFLLPLFSPYVVAERLMDVVDTHVRSSIQSQLVAGLTQHQTFMDAIHAAAGLNRGIRIVDVSAREGFNLEEADLVSLFGGVIQALPGPVKVVGREAHEEKVMALVVDKVDIAYESGVTTTLGGNAPIASMRLDGELAVSDYWLFAAYQAVVNILLPDGTQIAHVAVDDWAMTRAGRASVLFCALLLLLLMTLRFVKVSGQRKQHALAEVSLALLEERGRSTQKIQPPAFEPQNDDRAAYLSIAQIDQALAQLDADDPHRQQLLYQRDQHAKLVCLNGDFYLEGPWGRLTVTRGHSLTMGRELTPSSRGLSIDHGRVSRNQVEISYDSGSYWVTDTGSSNGTMVAGELLATGFAEPIKALTTIAMGGSRKPLRPGNCRYDLQRVGDDPKSLLVSVDALLRSLEREDSKVPEWHSYEKNAHQFHLMLAGSVVVSADPLYPLVTTLSDISDIEYKGLLRLTPTEQGIRVESDSGDELYVNQHPIGSAVPLMDGAEIRCGNLLIQCVAL